MGRTWSADEIYFDALASGTSAEVFHDDGFNFDAEFSNLTFMTLDIELSIEIYISNEIVDIDMHLDIEADENYSKYVDLMKLVPEKFRDSVALQQFLYEAGLQVGTWIGHINDLEPNLDPYRVGEAYIQQLANLIDLTIVADDTTPASEKRRQLIQAVAWYKMKGTYKSLHYVAYLLGLTINMWDMYTNDYVSFIDEDWFVGRVGENPPGLDSSYYKSPHIGFEVFLNRVYGTGSSAYLFAGTEFIPLTPYIEKTRPVNVVPHYRIFLNPVTNETGAVITVDGNINTCVIGDWSFYRIFFDDFVSSSAGFREFDDIFFFDYSATAFLNSITKFKLGTGSKAILPSNSGFALENVVMSGNVTSITEYPDRVEWLILLPNTTVQAGVSELGLYLFDGTTLEIASTFPDVNITSGIATKIVVKLYK